MTSIKVKFRASSREGDDGVIYYQVIHKRVVRIITTKYRIKSSEWDDKTSQIIKKEQEQQRLRYLSQIEIDIEDDLSTLASIINAMERKSHWYITSDVVDEFNCSAHGTSLYEFGQNAIDRLKELGHMRTAETYIVAINSFRKFREGKSINMESIDAAIMQDYERYLVVRGVAMNTVSFYMRILRAIYNKAVEQELIASRAPSNTYIRGLQRQSNGLCPSK